MNPRTFFQGHLLPVIFFFLAVIGACSSSQSFKAPQVELKKIRVIQITPEVVVLEGTLELYNPNDQAFRFSGYDYALQVAERRLVTGESKESFEVGGQSHSVIILPATLRFEDLSALLARDLQGWDIPYRLSGTVHLKTFFGTTPLSFSQQSTFNLSDFLREKARELLSRS
jgi:LEA14-like dessication related protein